MNTLFYSRAADSPSVPASRRRIPGLAAFFGFMVLALVSCASAKTRQKHYVEAMPLVREGSYDEAARIIEKSKKSQYKEKDRVLYYLDLGMLLHWAGEYEASSRMLTEAEEAIEELFTASISKGIASAFLNDNALDYAGEDYEDIYLNVFKALNYIALGDNEAAHVEIRRVQIKLNILEDKYNRLVEEYNSSEEAEGELAAVESRFHNAVLARYLSLLLYRAEGAMDDARIDREAMDEAWESQSHLYDFEKPPFPAPEYPDDGRALVNILSFSGLGPVKLADTFSLTSGPGMVFLAMAGQDDEYVNDLVGFTVIPVPGLPAGIHFKVQFPRLESRRTDADRIVVRFNGEQGVELPLLENIESIARETFLIKQPITVGRTIIRAAAKNIVKEVGKGVLRDELTKEAGMAGLLVGLLAGAAADAAVNATENADLRISHFFPSHVQAAEIAMEPGEYSVSVEYWNGSTLIDEIELGMRRFLPNRLNLVESYVLR